MFEPYRCIVKCNIGAYPVYSQLQSITFFQHSACVIDVLVVQPRAAKCFDAIDHSTCATCVTTAVSIVTPRQKHNFKKSLCKQHALF